MAGWKFWEWETDEERRDREAQDFLRRADQEKRDVDADRFLNDAKNWLGDRAGDVGRAMQGSLQGTQESYTSLAQKFLPEEPAKETGRFLGAAEPMIDPSGLATGTLERLGVPGGADTGMKSDLLDVLGKGAPGFGMAQDILEKTTGNRLKTGIDVEFGPREVLAAPLMAVSPVGKIVKGIEGATKVAGRYAKELEGVKSGFDFLDKVPVTTRPFPDEGIKQFVEDISTIFDETGGATYSVYTGDKLKSPEYAIGIFPDRSRVIEGHATPKDIQAFIEENKLPLKDPRVNVGLWENEGKTYMDLSVTVPHEEQAEALARHFNQLAYYDLKNQEEVFVGKTAEGLGTINYTKVGDKRYVSEAGEESMHIGEDGLVRADDTVGYTHDELKDMGYKGVYYPQEDQVHLFDDKLEVPDLSQKKDTSFLGGIARVFGDGPKRIIPIEEAAKLATPSQIRREHIAAEYGEDLAEVFDDSPWGRWTEEGLAIDLVRYQKEHLPGEVAPRGGVFYSPKNSDNMYKSDSYSATGGPEQLTGTTLFKNPLFVKTSDTGGLVHDLLNMFDKKEAQEIQDLSYNFSSEGPGSRSWRILTDVYNIPLEDLETIYDKVPSSEKSWAVKELVGAYKAREKGFDGIIGIQERPQNLSPEWYALDNYKYYQQVVDNNSGLFSEQHKQAYAEAAFKEAQKIMQQFNIDITGKTVKEIEELQQQFRGKADYKPFEVFDIRENLYPGPDGSWSVFDVFKPVGNALQQVPASQIRASTEGALAGGITAFQESDDQDPFSRALATIEGAAFGAGQRAIAKNALTQLRMSGASDAIIKSFNYKLIQGPKIERGEQGILKLMYNAMLSGPATMAGQFLSLGPEVGARVIRDLGSGLLPGHHQNIGGTMRGMLEGIRQGSYGLVDGLVNLHKEGAWEIPSRMIEAIDVWNRSIMYGMSVGFHAGTKADQLGLTGAAKQQYIKDALFDPVKAGVHEEAFADAMRAVYMTGEDRVSTLVNRGAGGTGKVKAGETGRFGEVLAEGVNKVPYVKAVLPFISTVHRMATRAVEFSPLGLAGTGIDVARGVYSPGRSTWGKNVMGDIQNVTPLNERLGNNVIGTSLFAWFWDQARQGNITAYGPDDQSTRDAMIRQGWQPYSIKVGDTYYDYRRMGPMAQLLAMAATPAEIEIYKKSQGDLQDHFMFGVRAYVALGEEMTYLRGITELIRGMTSGNMEPYLESSLRRLVPFGALLSSIATTMDPKMRDAVGWQGELMSMIPGVRQTLPERLDTFGEPRDNPKAGMASIIPTRVSKWEPTRIDGELQRLDLPAGRVPERITDENGIEHRLNDGQKREFQKIAGDGKRTALELLMASDFYQKADDAQKKTMITTVNRHASSWARETLYPGTVSDAELAKYSGDAVSAGTALVKALEIKAKLGDMSAKKYNGKTAEEAKEIDDWKSSLAAFRQQYGMTIGDQAFRNQYGMTAYVRAKTLKPSKTWTAARADLIKNNPEYNTFFGASLDPNEVQSAKTVIPA